MVLWLECTWGNCLRVENCQLKSSLAVPDPQKRVWWNCVQKVWHCRNLGSSNQIAIWWCHTGLSKESQLVLITSGKLIAKNWRKWTLKPIISVGLGRNKVVPSSFYYFKRICLNRCWHNTYVTCKCHPIKIPDWKLFTQFHQTLFF